MTPFDTYLIPGKFLLGLLLKFLQLSAEKIEPSLLVVFAGFISWLVWMTIIKIVWTLTLRIFGFEPRGRF